MVSYFLHSSSLIQASIQQTYVINQWKCFIFLCKMHYKFIYKILAKSILEGLDFYQNMNEMVHHLTDLPHRLNFYNSIWTNKN